jgi:phosphoglycolate phosphatase
MRYSTVIFDLDGTLLDTSEGIMVGVNYTAEKLGLPELTSERKKSFIGPPLIDSFIREFDLSENKAREAVGIYRQRYNEKGLYEAKQYNRIKELLVTLKEKNCKTAVATLKRDDFAKQILSHFELAEYFDVIKGIENDNNSKSEIILMCLKKLEQNDLSKVVMVGDSEYDAIGAEQVGIDFIAVTYGFGFKDRTDVRNYKNILIAENIEDIKSCLISSLLENA